MYYIIDCIQGNSKVGDYIIQICYVASMYVGSIALVQESINGHHNLPHLPCLFYILVYYMY